MPEITGPSSMGRGGDPVIDVANAVNNLILELAKEYPNETRFIVKAGEKKGLEQTAITVTAMQALGKIKGLGFGTFVVEGFITPGETEPQFAIRPATFEERYAAFIASQAPRVVMTEQWRADP